MPSAIRAFFDFLAKMGLTVRDDPPKTVDLEGRIWGEEAGGLVLSAASEAGIISVVLRNVSAEPRHVIAKDFSRWFVLDVPGAILTHFGQRLLSGEGARGTRVLDLNPGEAVEAGIPIQSLYSLNYNGVYRVQVRCQIDSETVLTSNRVDYHQKSE